MRKLILTMVISLSVHAGCSKTAPPPPAFEPCGSSSITISGQMGAATITGKKGTLDENSTSVTWTAPKGTTDSGNTAIDGASITDSTTFMKDTGARRFARKAKIEDHDDYTLTVTGVINSDCTGSGDWKVHNSSGAEVGTGTWSLP